MIFTNKPTSSPKILLIRFSSFGDITQTLSVPSKLKTHFGKTTEIHWITRKEFAPLLAHHPAIHKIWFIDKSEGLKGLFKIILQLKSIQFTHIYDAHNNLRSWLICFFIKAPNLIRKSQKRWKRFLLFRLRINQYRLPFSGQRDLIEPLKKWGISEDLPPTPQIYSTESARRSMQKLLEESNIFNFIVLAPSAAHPLKRWPINYWIKLIELHPDLNFILTGGPEDTFIQNIVQPFQSKISGKIINLAGKTSLAETVALIEQSKLLVANDTGVLHVAEQLGKRAIALMGPAPFGFPSRPLTKIMEIDLACRPCSKHGQGPCRNIVYHQCLIDITPEKISMILNELLNYEQIKNETNK